MATSSATVLGNAMELVETGTERGVVTEEEYRNFCNLSKKIFEARIQPPAGDAPSRKRKASDVDRMERIDEEFEPVRVLRQLYDGVVRGWNEGKQAYYSD